MMRKPKVFIHRDSETKNYIKWIVKLKNEVTEKEINNFYKNLYDMKLELAPDSENIFKKNKDTGDLISEFQKILNSDIINFEGLLDTYNIFLLESKINEIERKNILHGYNKSLGYSQFALKIHIQNFFNLFEISEKTQYSEEEIKEIFDFTENPSNLVPSIASYNKLKNEINSIKPNSKIIQLVTIKNENIEVERNKVYNK